MTPKYPELAQDRLENLTDRLSERGSWIAIPLAQVKSRLQDTQVSAQRIHLISLQTFSCLSHLRKGAYTIEHERLHVAPLTQAAVC